MTADPVFLSTEDVLVLHAEQLERYGGSSGLRDRGGLESATETARATFDGEYLHADLFEMGAAYAFHIAESQAFVDGNKRAGLNAALVFLLLSGWEVRDPEERLFRPMIAVSDRTMDKSGLAKLLKELAILDDEEEAF